MDNSQPEWDNQPAICVICMAERDDEGKCKCLPGPSIEETLTQMTQVTNDEGD